MSPNIMNLFYFLELCYFKILWFKVCFEQHISFQKDLMSELSL
jgi:hypothetical protein